MSRIAQAFGLLGACLALMGLVSGCSQAGTEMGSVEGTVTMDGQPLPNVEVEFQPEGEGGPSYGMTDETGDYELNFNRDTKGAMLGSHIVRITAVPRESDEGIVSPSSEFEIPEKYNAESTLKAEVQEGHNTFDFELESE